jgi:arylsulfatase A-like enzyme
MQSTLMKTLPTLALALLLAPLATLPAADSPKQKPNIIVILADDLGCQGSKEVVTPAIDSIAASGIRFTQGYISAPQCVPSRAGLLVGRDQNRFGAESNYFGHTYGNEKTFAQFLQEAGYITGMAGKWHGHRTGDRPFELGFHECFWNNGGAILLPDPETGFLKDHFRNEERVQEKEYSTDAYGRVAVAFIDRHAGGDKPFFYFLSFVPPHWPMEAKPEHMEQFAHVRNMHRRTMLAMMASLDENVGRVLDKLREKGIEEETLVFFLSDNGGPTGHPRTDPDAEFQHGQYLRHARSPARHP